MTALAAEPFARDSNQLRRRQLNRAIAIINLTTSRLPRDYEAVGRIATTPSRSITAGADRLSPEGHQRAIRNYQLYLTNAPPTAEIKQATDRLKELKSPAG